MSTAETLRCAFTHVCPLSANLARGLSRQVDATEVSQASAAVSSILARSPYVMCDGAHCFVEDTDPTVLTTVEAQNYKSMALQVHRCARPSPCLVSSHTCAPYSLILREVCKPGRFEHFSQKSMWATASAVPMRMLIQHGLTTANGRILPLRLRCFCEAAVRFKVLLFRVQGDGTRGESHGDTDNGVGGIKPTKRSKGCDIEA